MQLGLPKERHTGQSDDKSTMRLDRGWISIRIMFIKTSKVCITPTLKVESAIWFEDHSFVFHAFEIAHNHLESSGMRLFGTVIKASDLADCERDIRAGVGQKIQEHTNNQCVVECFVMQWPIQVDSKGGSSSRVSIGAAVFSSSS